MLDVDDLLQVGILNGVDQACHFVGGLTSQGDLEQLRILNAVDVKVSLKPPDWVAPLADHLVLLDPRPLERGVQDHPALDPGNLRLLIPTAIDLLLCVHRGEQHLWWLGRDEQDRLGLELRSKYVRQHDPGQAAGYHGQHHAQADGQLPAPLAGFQ